MSVFLRKDDLKKFYRLALALILLILETQVLAAQEQKKGDAVWSAAVFQNILPKQKNMFAVGVSTDASKVDLAQVDCLSLDSNWAHVDRINHSDDEEMRKALADRLEKLPLNSPNCGFFINWTIVHRKTYAVRYRGVPSVTLMSLSICKKPLDGPDGQQCLSKGIWLFDKITLPANEYAVGIKAFVSSPKSEWSVVNVSLKSQ
jgi:hypothetical protein